MRRDQTDAEAILWTALRNRGLGVKFRRQYPVGPYITDFACVEYGLVIELDGGQHADEAACAYDAHRTTELNAAGYRVIRFWNTEVLTSLEAVTQTIKDALS